MKKQWGGVETTEQFKFPKQSRIVEKASNLFSRLTDLRRDWCATNMADISYQKNLNNFGYSDSEVALKKLIRKFIFPLPGSPYTKGDIENISEVELTPRDRLQNFYEDTILLLLDSSKLEIKCSDVFEIRLNEFGVFNGASIAAFVKAIQKLESKYNIKINYTVDGYDSFEGLPSGSKEADLNQDGKPVWDDGYYTCTLGKTNESLRKFGVDSDKINLIKGWFDKTLTQERAQEINSDTTNLLEIYMVDCDTYPSSKCVFDRLSTLEHMEPFIIICDDWRLFNTDLNNSGESKAFIVYANNKSNLRFQRIKSYNRKSEAFLVTPNN